MLVLHHHAFAPAIAINRPTKEDNPTRKRQGNFLACGWNFATDLDGL